MDTFDFVNLAAVIGRFVLQDLSGETQDREAAAAGRNPAQVPGARESFRVSLVFLVVFRLPAMPTDHGVRRIRAIGSKSSNVFVSLLAWPASLPAG